MKRRFFREVLILVSAVLLGAAIIGKGHTADYRYRPPPMPPPRPVYTVPPIIVTPPPPPSLIFAPFLFAGEIVAAAVSIPVDVGEVLFMPGQGWGPRPMPPYFAPPPYPPQPYPYRKNLDQSRFFEVPGELARFD